VQLAGVDRELDPLSFACARARVHARYKHCFRLDDVRRLADDDQQAELVRWGREAVAHIEGFYSGDDYEGAGDVRFTFMKEGGRDEHRGPVVIGE
jgi:hypothetical protein